MADDTPLEWVLLYDGPCGLCQASVQWLMRRDRHQVLRYTSLQSVWAAEWSAHSGVTLPADSVAIVFGNRLWQGPEVLWKSLELLPAPWPIFARIGRLVPGQKKMYRWLARHRYTLFGKKEPLTTCPVPSSWHEPRPHSY